MRFLPTRVHGVLDYAVGLFVAIMPWLLGFAREGPETWLPVILGSAAVLYSLFTDYEWGAIAAIPMPTHLALDFANGLALAASPWLFGFAEQVWLPHVVLGGVALAVPLLTQPRPSGSHFLGDGLSLE
jgi:hypothetical protein